jgi:dethiobiotin synthetase
MTNPRATPRQLGLFVIGTDTEVGKTRISAGLLYAFASRGWRTAGYKPVAAGQDRLDDGRWVNEDVEALRRAGSLPLSDAEVGPWQWRSACAPHIAEQLDAIADEAAGRTHRRLAPIGCLAGARRLQARADLLVVEGVGGFTVPLTDGSHPDLPWWGSDDLALGLGLPVVLVVGMRLGCINHALLTAEVVRARGLRLLGWVANTVDAGMGWRTENLQALRALLMQRYGAVCLGEVPRLADPTPAAVAAGLDAALLARLLGVEENPA